VLLRIPATIVESFAWASAFGKSEVKETYMPVLLYHYYEVFIILDRWNPVFLIDNDRSLGSWKLKADMRVIPIMSLNSSVWLTSKSHNVPFAVEIRNRRNVQEE
jgi:hypothetical protein